MAETEKTYVKAVSDDDGSIRISMNGRTFEVIRLVTSLAKHFLSDLMFSDADSRYMFKDMVDDIYYGTLERRGDGWEKAVLNERESASHMDMGKAN